MAKLHSKFIDIFTGKEIHDKGAVLVLNIEDQEVMLRISQESAINYSLLGPISCFVFQVKKKEGNFDEDNVFVELFRDGDNHYPSFNSFKRCYTYDGKKLRDKGFLTEKLVEHPPGSYCWVIRGSRLPIKGGRLIKVVS